MDDKKEERINTIFEYTMYTCFGLSIIGAALNYVKNNPAQQYIIPPVRKEIKQQKKEKNPLQIYYANEHTKLKNTYSFKV